MKWSVIADVHANNALPMARMTVDGLTDRLVDIVKSLRVALEHKADAAIICGDLYHTRLLDAPTITAISHVFSENWGKPIFILPGNHDAHDSAGEWYNVNYLSDVGNVQILGEGRFSNQCGMLYALPYLNERLAKERIKQMTNGDILFCHQSIAGAHQGGWVNKTGLVTADYANFNHVIAGHFHEHQTFQGGFYVGSLVQLGWTESEKKGFWEVDIDKGKITQKKFIQVPCPRFNKVQLTEPNYKSIDQAISAIVGASKNPNYLWLEFSLAQEHVMEAKQSVEKAMAAWTGQDQVRNISWTISLPQGYKKQQKQQKYTTLPPLEVVMEDYVGADTTVAEKAKMVRLGKDILAEAKR